MTPGKSGEGVRVGVRLGVDGWMRMEGMKERYTSYTAYHVILEDAKLHARYS